jgi:nicotinate-nucleotide adenylyltransferase
LSGSLEAPAGARASLAAGDVTAADPQVPAPAPVVAGSLGLLGGTFDPVHHGHLAIAEEAREVLGLQRVLFIPAANPPHKRDRAITPGEQRLAMLELAVADNPAFGVSRIELDRGDVSYTVDTLEALRESGVSDPWFILSSEALEGFPEWRRPDRILELCRLLVVPRAGHAGDKRHRVIERFRGREDRFAFLPGPLLPISGSVVRRRVAAGRSVRYLVPDPVIRYLNDHRLYATADGGS